MFAFVIRPISAIFAVLLAAVIAAYPQTRSPFDTKSDPFKLVPGTTFAASGGNAAAKKSTLRIAADIAEAERIISQNYAGGPKISPAEMTRAAAAGALRSLDPHSSFFDRRQWSEMLADEQSGYSGIGISIGEFTRNGQASTYVLESFPGTAAARAKLAFGDRIIDINGRSMAETAIDDIRDMLRGTENTSIKLTVERAATGRTETIELRRGNVSQPSIPDSYIISPGVGYIDLTEGFTFTTGDELDTALRGLKRQGISSLVVDLRGNPGGIVEQAVKAAEKFLPAGTLIVSQRGRSAGDNRDWYSSNRTPETMPLVLLVDDHTASASEIFAGAMQDQDRATIIGSRTFGKGLVQSVIDLPGGTGITLTAARYYTPSGRSIQRDYSSIGNYDYFRHVEKADAIETPYFEARTNSGRRVFGGNGIAPDIAAKNSPETAFQARLNEEIFFFVRNEAAANTGSLRSADSKALAAAFISRIGSATLSAADQAQCEKRAAYFATLSRSTEVLAKRIIIRSDSVVLAALSVTNRRP